MMERCSGQNSPGGLSAIAACKGLLQVPRGAISHLPFKSNPRLIGPESVMLSPMWAHFFPCSQARTGVFYLEPGTSTCLSQCQPLRLPSSAYSLEPWPHRKMLSRTLTKHGPDSEGSIAWVPEQIHFPSPSLYHPLQLAAQKEAQGSPGGCPAHQGLKVPQKRCQVHEACRGL